MLRLYHFNNILGYLAWKVLTQASGGGEGIVWAVTCHLIKPTVMGSEGCSWDIYPAGCCGFCNHTNESASVATWTSRHIKQALPDEGTDCYVNYVSNLAVRHSAVSDQLSSMAFCKQLRHAVISAVHGLLPFIPFYLKNNGFQPPQHDTAGMHAWPDAISLHASHRRLLMRLNYHFVVHHLSINMCDSR